MAAKIQVWDENRQLLWDSSSRLGLLFGEAVSDSTPGNGFAANLPPGEFFYVPIITDDALGYIPIIGYANGRVYWNLNRDGNGNPVGTIKPIKFYYGVR
ncbi:hypothetical protein [Stenotrophomonas phage BUCT603]|nr:hypothetical protein [Stenotrophomonas phage BUCT603]